MVGSDGKHVIGADGRVVMVDAQGRPVRGDAAHGAGADAKEEKGKEREGKRKRRKCLTIIPRTRYESESERNGDCMYDG